MEEGSRRSGDMLPIVVNIDQNKSLREISRNVGIYVRNSVPVEGGVRKKLI